MMNETVEEGGENIYKLSSVCNKRVENKGTFQVVSVKNDI